MFNLCVQTNPLLSLIEFELGISLGNLIYSSICIIILGYDHCDYENVLTTVVLLLCLMSNM